MRVLCWRDAGQPWRHLAALGDGRIEWCIEPEFDERVPPRERIRVRWAGDAGLPPLMDVTSHGLGSSVRALGPGSVVLADVADAGGERHQVLVDLEAPSFAFHPHERPQPLHELAVWLRHRSSPAGVLPPVPRTVAGRLGEAATIAGGVLLAVAGGWMALGARTPGERLTGLFGLVFFGACAALPLHDRLRDLLRARKRRGPGEPTPGAGHDPSA